MFLLFFEVCLSTKVGRTPIGALRTRGHGTRTTRRLDSSLATMDVRRVICSICNHRFRDPKVLPCFHVYCRDCIDQLRVACRPGMIRCPECAKDVTVANGDPENLPDALHVYHRIDLQRLDQRLISRELTCDMCLNDSKREVTARGFCYDCGQHLCAACITKHTSEYDCNYSRHTLVTYEELSSDAERRAPSARQDVVRRRRAATFSYSFSRCRSHLDAELTHYCEDCSQRVCESCQLDQHRGHKCHHYRHSAAECKKRMEELLPTVQVVHKRLAGASHEAKKSYREIEAQGKHLADSIDTSFMRLSRILDRRREEMQRHLSQVVQAKCNRLAWQQTELRKGEEELDR